MIDEPTEQEAERAHWFNVIRILQSYKSYIERDLDRRQQHLNNLPKSYADRLPDSSFHILQDIDRAADSNQTLFTEIGRFQKSQMRYQNIDGTGYPEHRVDNYINASDQHRNEAILHSFYREWTLEGKPERDASFQPLLNELCRYLPVTKSTLYKQKVLVPGSGLGRLPLEITAQGYCCQGNEYSAFMAAPSNFILNQVHESKVFTIYPWVDRVCNVVRQDDVLQAMALPDVTADEVLSTSTFYQESLALEEKYDVLMKQRQQNKQNNSDNITTTSTAMDDGDQAYEQLLPCADLPRFSMGIGNFVELYFNQENKQFWDAVVTCFFLDTAPVAMEYIETIFHALRPGGIWTNIGPLLYHWVEDVDNNQDDRYKKSIELSWTEMEHVIKSYGFEFVTVPQWREVNYTRCETSMMWTVFRTVHFTVMKPSVSAAAPAVVAIES